MRTGIPKLVDGKVDVITAEELTKKLPNEKTPRTLLLRRWRRKCSDRPPPIENPPIKILSNLLSRSRKVGRSCAYDETNLIAQMNAC